ncbi:MAG TPA: hypothetical protein VNZ66_01995 [Aeromicrobium sp.]|nr:hypothetical protein [Aeromicrobium sp.]
MFEPHPVATTERSSTERMEWGPAHLREDAPTYEIEWSERPDDN